MPGGDQGPQLRHPAESHNARLAATRPLHFWSEGRSPKRLTQGGRLWPRSDAEAVFGKRDQRLGLRVPELQAERLNAAADGDHGRTPEHRVRLVRLAQPVVRDLRAQVVDVVEVGVADAPGDRTRKIEIGAAL